MNLKKVSFQSKYSKCLFKKLGFFYLAKSTKYIDSKLTLSLAKQSKLQSITITSPTIKLKKYLIKKSNSHLNFIDSFSLKYFSYLVGVLQRSGSKLSYWRMVTKVICDVSRFIQFKCGENTAAHTDISGMSSDSYVKDLSGTEEKQNLILLELSKTLLFFWKVVGIASNFLELRQLQHSPFNKKFTQKVTSKIISLIAMSLKMSYMVRYRALDRKLRKIVKNKYRYVRFYTMVNPKNRIKAGLRLFLIGLSLRSNQKLDARLLELLADILTHPTSSLLLNLRSRHQTITLSTLTLAM